MLKVASIGECMLELSNGSGGSLEKNMNLQFSYGGDTLNTAVYLARLNVNSGYLTALGNDPYSSWLLAEWEKEHVDTTMVVKLPDRSPGLYLIQNDVTGERSFHYWRSSAAARDLFADQVRADNIHLQLAHYDMIYLSGISLSLYDDASLERVFYILKSLREKGKKIVFDSNYRVSAWGKSARAKLNFQRIFGIADIVLPTFEDEKALFGDSSPANTAKRLHDCGVSEIAVKDGASGVFVSVAGDQQWVSTEAILRVVDSTAAGDSFNAGYLAARARGLSARVAASYGNQLAGKVIQYRGAIIPLSAMPELGFER